MQVGNNLGLEEDWAREDDANDVREDREDIQESPIANFDVCGCCCIVSLCDFQRCLRSPEALDATWSSCRCRSGAVRRCWIITIASGSLLVDLELEFYVGMWSVETNQRAPVAT